MIDHLIGLLPEIMLATAIVCTISVFNTVVLRPFDHLDAIILRWVCGSGRGTRRESGR